jgi:FAD/FMN-containing dehydrogenase
MMAISMAWNPAQKDYIIWAPNMYLKPTPFPPLFAEIKGIAPKALASTMRITNLTGMTDEVQATAPNGARAEWWSLTLEPNGQLPLDIQLKGREIFAPILDREGLSFAITLQPLNAGLAAGGKSGGNPSGITPQNGDSFRELLIPSWCFVLRRKSVLLGCSFWVSPEDDEIVKQKTREHLAWAESTARERGLLKPFIYPNYANGIQDIFHGFGQQNLQKMRQVRDVYDPENVFGRYWRGGFKLGVDATKVLEKEL